MIFPHTIKKLLSRTKLNNDVISIINDFIFPKFTISDIKINHNKIYDYIISHNNLSEEYLVIGFGDNQILKISSVYRICSQIFLNRIKVFSRRRKHHKYMLQHLCKINDIKYRKNDTKKQLIQLLLSM